MFDTLSSAGSTLSEAPGFHKPYTSKSLADELDAAFEDAPLDLAESLDQAKSPKASREDAMEDTRKVGDVIPEECEQSKTTQGQSVSPAMADGQSNSLVTLVSNNMQSPTTNIVSDAALG